MVFNKLTLVLLFCCLDNGVESINVFGSMAPMVDAQFGTDPDKCPVADGWVTTPTNPCSCLYIENEAPVGTTYMSANEFCINEVDSRSSILEFNNQEEMVAFQESLMPYQGLVGGDIPVGFYMSTGTDVRSLSNQTVLPPFSPPINGKCEYFLPSSTAYTCSEQVSAVACTMKCDNPPVPPPPTETVGGPRCDDPFYNSTCPSGWINLGGVCYKNPANTLATYSDAVTACQTAGGWLPSFSNIAEWTAVKNYVYTTGIAGVDSYAAPMWLGASLSGTTATWTDGTPWQFSYWAPYQPLSGSTCMRWSVTNGGYWSAGDCDIPGVVFCQYYDPCPTTSTTSTSGITTSTSTTSTSTSTTTTTTAMPTTTTATTTSTSTPTTLTSVTTMASSAGSTIPGICVNQMDFSTKCLQNPAAYYWKGICYEIASNCSSPSRPGIVREIDIIENFIQKAQQGSMPILYPISLYVGSSNNDPNSYVQLNGMVSSTGQHRLVVSLGAGQCLGLTSTTSMDNVYTITDSIPCTGSMPMSLCETLSTFQQKGCEQSLSSGSCTVGSTVSTTNVTDCTKQCSMNDWCAGVNYNQQGQTCNFLSENSSKRTIVCDPGWLYYERV